jgi:hypothetical protein
VIGAAFLLKIVINNRINVKMVTGQNNDKAISGLFHEYIAVVINKIKPNAVLFTVPSMVIDASPAIL